MSPALSDDLSLALALADEADAVTVARFRALDLEIRTKLDRTPVTDADRAAERTVRDRLASERPDDAILGEEYGDEGRSRRRWVIDPIDGTANFLRGVPVWGTLIALTIDDEPIVGVCSMPALGRRWWAASGLGAHTRDLNGSVRRIRVSDVSQLEKASVALSGLDRFEQVGRLEHYLELARRVWRTRDYSDALPYMFLAEGVVDVAGEYDLQPYDMAALVPIVREAGGVFTGIHTDEFSDGSVLATNGRLHDDVRAILAA